LQLSADLRAAVPMAMIDVLFLGSGARDQAIAIALATRRTVPHSSLPLAAMIAWAR